uniref:Uncharacterized protein n=1 Tax=Globodera rostochiensis TaxID=31243 RepID=A0A914I7L6_GLORO
MAPKRQNEQFLEESQKPNFGDSSKENNGPRKFKQEKPENDVIILDDDEEDRKPLVEKSGPSKRGRKPRWDKQQQEPEELPPRKIRANESDGEEKSQPSVFDYPTIFWKLARPKYGTFTFMCKDCQNANFLLGDRRFVLAPQNGDGRLEFTQTFCRDCAKLNFDCTDLIMKHQKKLAPTKNGHYHPYTGGNWATVGTLEKQYVIVHLRDGRKYRFRVPSGSFLSPQQLERGIHHGMIAEMERLMTRKRAALVEEEGELFDLEVVEEEQGVEPPVEAPLLPLRNETAAKERERAQKEQKERLAYEKENDRLRRLEEDRKEKERLQRVEEDRKEKERLQRVEEDRKEKDRLENERKAKRQKWLEDGRKETERQRQEAARKEIERLQRIENATNENERKEKERKENERKEKERKENERKENERKEKEWKENERKENERKENERKENERKENELKESERVGKLKQESASQDKNKEEERMRRDQERKIKLRELELLKELKPYRGGWMRLVQGKDPTPDVHYLHEKDEYHFANAVDKYRIYHPELPWDLPAFNPSAQIQRNIAEFKGLFEREVYDENYGSKTREEKEELLVLVKGFRFYYMEDIGRFMLKIFDNKISHITLTDQLAYVLGYEQEQQILNEDLAKYSVDLGGGVSHLCIYLNSGIIESMIFGNTFANLLQVIAVEGKSGSVVEKDFQTPLFHKIIAREVDVLDVEIRTLTGREVPFDFGQVVLTLQFKKFYQQTGSGPIAYFEGLPTFQRGYGYFLGVPRQKGAGVGAVLRNLWRYLRPMISAAKPYAANIATELGKEGLETGARVLSQVSKGGDIKEALLAEGKEGAKKLLDKASSSLQKGRGKRKRRGKKTKAEIILKPFDVIHPITSYIDLSKVFVFTEFKIKKIAEDGLLNNIGSSDSVGLIQMPGATFIRNLKVHINQREVYDSNQLYSYKVYLDTELSYPIAAKDAYFGVAGYFRYTDLSKANDKRRKPLAESKAYQTISKLSADIFNQDLYMISNVEIDIELALQSDDFMLHQEKEKDKFVLEISDCRLIVKTVDLMDGLSLDIARKLDVEPARFGIRKSFMKSLFITGGRYDFSANLFTEEVPRRVIIGLVANQNYIGHKQKNPFFFNHHNVRDIELTASGRTYPQYPYNLDYKNNNYARAYHDAQEHLGLACTTESNGLSYSMFKTAFCLYVFQMTNSQEDSPGFELIKEGCTAGLQPLGFICSCEKGEFGAKMDNRFIDKILFENPATRKFFMGTFPSDGPSWQAGFSLVRDLGQVTNRGLFF